MTPEKRNDLERAVIAAAIDKPELLAEIAPILRPEDLELALHRSLWTTVIELDSAGKRADLLSVVAHLGPVGSEALGGVSGLAQFVDSTPTTADVPAIARLLALHATVRRVQDLCASSARAEVESPSEWLLGLETAMYRLTETRQSPQTTTLPESYQAVVTELRTGGGLEVLPSGLWELDDLIGGWRRGTQAVVAARPGIGKTAFALGCALHAAKQGHSVVFVSLEMTANQLTLRAMAQLSGLDARALEQGHLGGWEDPLRDRARRHMQSLPVAIDATPGLSVAGIRSAIRRGVARLHSQGHRARLGLVVVDYLQIMGTDARVSSREQAVSECSRGLMQLAKEFDCAVVTLSQLNREVEKRGADARPKLSDLRESGAIEQDAYAVIALWRDPQAPQTAEALVLKIRQGGQCGVAPLTWDGPQMAYGSLAQRDDIGADFDR
jgi:replicative DNA helicase